MKQFLKVTLAVVLAGCAVCGCGRRDYGAKLNPTYKSEAAKPYVVTLKTMLQNIQSFHEIQPKSCEIKN